MRLPISALGLLALTSCSMNEFSQNPVSAEVTAAETKIHHDHLNKVSLFDGPPLRQHPTVMSNWFLRHVANDSGPSSTVIRIDDFHRGAWKFLSSADTAQGETLELERIGGKVLEDQSMDGDSPTRVVESYVIRPTPEQVERWAETGVEIQMSSQTSRGSLEIPAHYVKGFLSVTKAAPPSPSDN